MNIDQYRCTFLRLENGVPVWSVAHISGRVRCPIDVWRLFLVSFAKVQTASGYSFDEGWGQPADAVICYLLIVTFRRDRNVRWILTETCDDDYGALSFRTLISLHAEICWCLVFFVRLLRYKPGMKFMQNVMDQRIIPITDLHVFWQENVLRISVYWNFCLWKFPFYWNVRARNIKPCII